jgi:N-acetylmuramate 1-kinase
VVTSITPMPGGASTRKYFRLAVRDGGSAVGMFVPDADASEESTRDLGVRPRWPFLEVRDLLEAHDIRVPRLLAENTVRGWLLIEDLGDDTLAARIAAHPDEREPLYRTAARELARAQVALREVSPEAVIGGRGFDEELLFWELEHFREWGLDARGKKLSASDRTTFDTIARRLARRIAGWPRGFTHRDYQSRNLMVKDGALVWIDFQDALMGPQVYDLVALLQDSYQEFERSFIDTRLVEYADVLGLSASRLAELRREFDVVTVQRKLKDAGRFVFIERVKGNTSFLPYVDPTLRKVKEALERLSADEPDARELHAVLRRVLPEVM